MEMSQWNILYSYLKQTKRPFFFCKTGEQEGKTGSVCGVDTSHRGVEYKEKGWKGEYGNNIVYTCI
jgi:hypothetical protein